HIVDKPLRAFAIATAAKVRNEQLGFGFDRRPRPDAPRAINRGFDGRDVFVFRGTETPEFINLNAARLHAANLHVMKARTEAPSVLQELRNRVDPRIRKAR